MAFALVLALAPAALGARTAAPVFENISLVPVDRLNPLGGIGTDRAGNLTVLLETYDGRILVVDRPPGGQFGPPHDIARGTLPTRGGGKVLAVGPRGDAVVIFQTGSYSERDERFFASVRPAGGSFGAPVEIPGSRETLDFAPAMDAQGNLLVAFSADRPERTAPGLDAGVFAAFRPAGGEFGPSELISSPANANEPVAAFDAAGNALVAFNDVTGGVQVVRRPAGGRFEAPQTLGSDGLVPDRPLLEVDPQGRAVVAWNRQVGRGSARVLAAFGSSHRPESFRRGRTVSARIDEAAQLDVAIGPGGVATVVWERRARGRLQIRAAIRRRGRFGREFALSRSYLVSRDAGGSPEIEVDARGTTTVIWQGISTIDVARRRLRRSFSAPRRASRTQNIYGYSLATTPSGEAVIVFANDRGLGTLRLR